MLNSSPREHKPSTPSQYPSTSYAHVCLPLIHAHDIDEPSWTVLISYRVWKIQRSVKTSSMYDLRIRSRLVRIVVVAVESCTYSFPYLLTDQLPDICAGAVYSAFLFVLIGTYAADSPAMFIILDMVRFFDITTTYPSLMFHPRQTAPVIVRYLYSRQSCV